MTARAQRYLVLLLTTPSCSHVARHGSQRKVWLTKIQAFLIDNWTTTQRRCARRRSPKGVTMPDYGEYVVNTSMAVIAYCFLIGAKNCSREVPKARVDAFTGKPSTRVCQFHGRSVFLANDVPSEALLLRLQAVDGASVFCLQRFFLKFEALKIAADVLQCFIALWLRCTPEAKHQRRDCLLETCH